MGWLILFSGVLTSMGYLMPRSKYFERSFIASATDKIYSGSFYYKLVLLVILKIIKMYCWYFNVFVFAVHYLTVIGTLTGATTLIQGGSENNSN